MSDVWLSLTYFTWLNTLRGFPGVSDGKESSCSAGDLDLIFGSGRSPGEGNGNPLQNSCLEISMNRGTWWASVHGVARSHKESDMTKHGYTFTFNPLRVHLCCCKWQDFLLFYSWIIQFSSVTQSCLTLCNPMKYLIPSYFYSFIYQWILSLLPCIGKVNNVEVKVGLPMSFLVSVLVFFG